MTKNVPVAWRYVILHLHESRTEIVPHLNEHDHKTVGVKGLARVFIDNYAAIPSSLFVAYLPYVKRESFIFSPSVKTTNGN